MVQCRDIVAGHVMSVKCQLVRSLDVDLLMGFALLALPAGRMAGRFIIGAALYGRSHHSQPRARQWAIGTSFRTGRIGAHVAVCGTLNGALRRSSRANGT